jgi:prepilin-type N-terminal cleavage/methylation domain-containing protein
MNNKGYSIIEMLIVMSVGLVIIGGVYEFNVSQGKAYSRHQDLVYSQESARLIMVRLSQDIRRAGLKQSGVSLVGIAAADGKSIRILSDLDLNGNTSGPGEDITYIYDPVSKTISKNGSVMYKSVSNLSFSYILSDGSITSNPSDLSQIRRISIGLQVAGRNNIIDLYTDVTPRNLGL